MVRQHAAEDPAVCPTFDDFSDTDGVAEDFY